jgi:Lrp/AsnC family transcriptional regulator
MAMALKVAERLADRMDRIDRKIVFELQRDATLSVAQLGERVGLSQTPCWKRIQKLEQAGVITGRVALVDPDKIDLGLTVFVEIEAADHSPAWREAFARAVAEMPEVIEGYRMAGDVDYLLKIVMPDMGAFDDFYKRLTARLELKNVTSQFAMERLKGPAPYPIDTSEP